VPTSAKTVPARVGKAYQLLPVIGPSAGVDLRTSPTLLHPEQARELVNFSLTEPGALVVRPGWQVFSTSVLGSGRPQGAVRVYLNTAIPAAASTQFTLLGWHGGLYLQTDSGGWASTTPVLSGLSTSAVFSFPYDRDLVGLMDGSNTPFKSTNGSSWTKLGIAASSTGPTLSSLSTGGLSSGDYEVTWTYKDRDLSHESNGATASTITLSASSGAIKVVVDNSTDPQVDALVFYARKVSAGETILRKISSQAQSAGATSTAIITSTTWTTNDEVPIDHDAPPVLSFGVVWKNRWWARSATVTNRLHFTQLFQPQSWPGLFYIDMPFERGDAIVALVPLGDTLLVFGHTKIFVILGQTSLDFEVRPTLASEDGALGQNAVVPIENGVVHAGATGIYIFDGATDRLLSFDIEPAWQDYIAQASATELATTPMVYHQNEKELRIAVSRRYPSGTRGEWVMDLNRTRTTERPAWTATDRTVGGYCLWNGPEPTVGNRQRLFSYHSSQAQLVEEATGTTANGGHMTATYEGPGLTLGTHRGRWVDLRGEYEPHAGACSIEPVVDGVSQGTQSVAIGTGLAAYGSGTYGSATYAGTGRRQFHRMLPLGADGRTFVLKLTYTGQEAFRLYSYHPGLVPETASRAFSE
jgi:hypothetical protein